MTEGPVSFNRIILSPPRCPLCHKKMEHAYDPVRKKNIIACRRDEIAIDVTDPLVDTWGAKREKIPCPNCNADMRVFFTSTGFLKAVCPKRRCRCTVRGSNPDRFTMAPALKLDGVAEGEAS